MKKEEIEQFLLRNLNNALDINGENSFTGSFTIKVLDDDTGFYFIPNLPVSYALNKELYFKISSLVAGIIYPYKTLIVQSNAYFVPLNRSNPNLARALYFPWKNCIPQRLEIDENIESFILNNNSKSSIPLMVGLSLDVENIIHLAVSGSSGSGKSYLTEYLIRTLKNITDDITLVDPKLSRIYKLGKELNINVLSPEKGDNLNSFILQVNELLGKQIEKIYRRQELLLNDNKATFEHTFIVIDELLALVQGSSKKARDIFAQLLGTIALLGRETKVHLLLISQRFDATAFGGNLAVREQINCSILLGEINSNTAQFLFPNANVDNIVVPSGIGTGIIKIIDGKHEANIMPFLAPTYSTMEETTHV